MLHRKVLYTLLLLGLCWTLTVNGQNTVESIRKNYQGVQQWINQMSDNFLLEHNLASGFSCYDPYCYSLIAVYCWHNDICIKIYHNVR